MSKKFKLSASLFGHSLDVRSVVVTNNNSIISGSRDKTAKFWTPNRIDTGYTPIQTFRDQKNFVIAVLYLEPTSEYPDGLVITGGNDNTIYVYKPSEPFATFTLKEHTNAVSCFSKYSTSNNNAFLSGSWDCSAKLWTLGNSTSTVTFSGHLAAIWSIIQLADSRIVTASADKTIGIWSSEGARLNSLTGHTDCVRGLVDLSELHQFVSVANDATIRVWSYAGESQGVLYGHTNYIYSIARCKSAGENCFVTSDEDRTVRFWQNGENIETIQLPAQSVWSVACLSNGDIVTGSSDGVVRVFTQNESRYADEATLNKFNEEVEALTRQSTQEIGGYKISDLPGKEALYDPGRKAGQMKMIREGTGVVAYTWVEDGDKSHWEKVGDVLGSTDKTNQDKTMYEGKAYDFVFSVDVEDGKPPLKLPYNKGDDPYQAAHNFLAKNFLPASYLEQVVDFILKNTQEKYVPPSTEYVDPFTGGSRYTPSTGNNSQDFAGRNFDPFTGGSSYSTSATQAKQTVSSSTISSQVSKFFPINTYRTFEMGDSNVILVKLKEFNEKTGDSQSPPVNEHYLVELVKLCNGPPDDPNAFDTLFKLLEWPDEIVFPVVDVIRMAVRFKKNNEIIATANSGSLLRKLLSFINENCNIINNVIVALRTLSNLLMHEFGEDLVFEHRFDVVENITALGPLNKNGQIALSTLLLNLCVASLKKRDDLGISVLADVIPDILTKLSDPESQFRSYVALGTLLSSPQSAEVKAKVKSNVGFISALESHVLSGQGDLEEKRRNCASQVQEILNLSF
ncbi:phospholipase A-2-activating protein [Tribolium castaneum]|uniref:Phospholipase A-2-activating protein-like Protein n=1 Tax=Tribolium castaneum TaxID=7070 RepID=D6X170_TRICA|nr:PREDICTED: phospholipase A-2-activating protein [Tribolium castaneum]EFA09359.2 Phospholipase A-2-activating protein-like Protein [Tribolium castaneum]|eukprot:XP_968238.2 PREDICTED: phospholipase A-2-activating protein [Tribolium castaneum]